MPKNSESLNRSLFDLLHSKGFDPTMLDTSGKEIPTPEEAEVFQFNFIKDGEDYGKVTISIDGMHKLCIYFSDEVADSEKEESHGEDESWYKVLNQLKRFAQKYQLSFELKNVDHLKHDMAKREYMKKQERISEGYYPMGKKASYNDAVPNVKIVIQHTRQIEEGEQRYRNIAKIFLENSEGERFLAPTIKPGVARVYGRLIAEGDKPHGERWNHVTSLVEEYQKMGAFVRATRNGQFNESAQRLVNEGINHYQGLRETLSRMTGHRGYNTYFESWTPSLMEEESEENNLNELFVQETLDPRIESVMPILNKLQKKVAEMKEVGELSEWADSLTEAPGAETLGHNVRTDAKNLRAFDLEESEDDIDDPVVSSITRRIIRQHPELLKHGPDKVLAAIADVADFVGDVEEIGSSDVSGWVKQVARQLNGVDEGMFDKVKDAVKTVGGKVLNKLGHDDDTELLKKIQKDAGIPASAQHGKPNMGHSKDEERLEELSPTTIQSAAAKRDAQKPEDMSPATQRKDIMTHMTNRINMNNRPNAVEEEDVEESALQASFGIKKYGKKGMEKLRAAGRKHASKKTMQNIRAEYSDKEKPVTEVAGQLSIQQLATISDEALDNAYKYGRSSPGNTFGWQANLKSAQYAKQMIDKGVTDIEAISDAIHKGWNVTAQAFVQNPEQFDDTAKLQTAGKLEAKLKQRAELMKKNYSQLPEEEKEKDRVVARALLQALKGQQGQQDVSEGQEEFNSLLRLLGEGWKGELAGGTLGGVSGTVAGSALGALAGGPVGAAIGGVVGGAAGGTAGQMAGRELTKEDQLNEVAPLLAAGARAIIPLLSKVGPKLGQMASGAGKAGAEVVGKTATGIGRGTVDVAKSAAQSAAQNAGKVGVGVGAYQAITDVADSVIGGVGEVYRDAGKAAGAIAQAVGDAVDGKTIAELAGAAVKYSIPIGILLAVLYGGKKLIDQVMSEGADDTNMGALGKMVGAGTPNPSDFAQGFKKTFEGQEDLDTIRRLLKK